MAQTDSLRGIAEAAPPEPRKGLRGHPWLTLFTVGIGAMMVTLDGTIVAVANPAIQADLNASLEQIQWITNGYLLALGVSLITAGKLGDRFGHRKTFLVGVTGFAVTSAAIALSGSPGLVIAFRVLQGVFGSLLQPAALGMLRASFPAKKLNMAIGIWGAVIGASIAAGPIVGGVLVEHVNWESVFYLNVPVGVLAFVLGVLILRKPKPQAAVDHGRFDFVGVVLLSVSMFCLIFSLIKADAWGWTGGKTVGLLAAAVVLGIGFALWEARVSSPLIPLSLFRSVSLSAATVVTVLMAFAFMGGLFFITFYLQNVHGMSPVDSGVHLLPVTAMMIIGSPIGGALMAKYGPKIPLAGGMLLSGVAILGLASLDADAGTMAMSLWFVLLGLGLAPVIVASTDVIVSNAPEEHAGIAGGLQQAAMQVGGSLGTAVLGAVMASKVGDTLPDKWREANLPPVDGQQEEAMKDAVSVGLSPAPKDAPKGLVDTVTGIAHDCFISGMGLAFTISAVIAGVGALLALLTKRGSSATGETAVHV
ncbi:MFS transporter [Streptomyces kanamyceticus]|uniref:DHA2 family efflux MFS transporter permease subunit n=1 Tax=Streptomyces kanamyceticus TaxID=1967 RepID=A0A5J6GP17_STRKN|nr:MFS transporter [Streptomyces kanamyceticus]QEU95735.1 DHA2 family efflux MFS transporter permease subunit [Streptomyces kanamyceticus]